MPYTAPTAAAFKVRYPVFAAVADATINAMIVEANRFVDESWFEGDYQPAIMALAAHRLTLEGFGTSVAAQLGGFKSLTVGPLSLTRSDSAGDAGSLSSTIYGQAFLAMLRANHPGIIAIPARVV